MAAYFVGQAALLCQSFKERVVYQGLDYHAEELALQQELAVWKASLLEADQVGLGGCELPGAPWEVTVHLTPELTQRILDDVDHLHKAFLHAAKDSTLTLYLDGGQPGGLQ